MSIGESRTARPRRTPQPPALAQSGGYRWAALAAATAAQAGSSFAMQGIGAFAGFLQQSFGLSGTAVGLLVTVAGAAPVGALLVVGHLLDRHSERRIVGWGAAIAAGGLALSALAHQYAFVLVGLFVLGVGYSTAQPGGSKSVAAWFPAERRGLAMGIRQAGLPVGGAASALAVPAVAHAWGWHAAFWLAAAVALAGGVIFALVYRPPAWNARGAAARPLLSGLVTQLRRRAMPSIVISGTVLVTAQYGVTTYLMLYLRDAHGMPLTRGAIVLFGTQATGALGRIVLAGASDRFAGRLAWVRVAMIGTAASLLALPLLPDHVGLTPVLVIAAFLGFFGFGWYGPWVALVSESAPPDQVGLALGCAMAANQVAIVGTPPLLGLIHDASGYRALWWTLVALLALATPALRQRPPAV